MPPAASGCGLVPRYAVPERVTFVEALTRTSVGKLEAIAATGLSVTIYIYFYRIYNIYL
jgi:hypothetical protein